MRSVVIALCLLTCSCAAQRVHEADAAMDTAIQACKQQYPNPDRDTLARSQCEEPARRARIEANGTPSDLINLFLARRNELASQVDKGQITKERAAVLLAETQRELTADFRERQRADSADRRDSLRTLQAIQPRQPIQTNCSRFGNTTNCTTY